jgi:hypothetical protein
LGERAGELGEDGQAGMKPDPLDASNAERGECPFVLEASELGSTEARLR